MSAADKSHFKLTDKRDLIGYILEHRYEVEDLIGEGAMGYVYRGRQIRLKRSVAIKVPRPELTANAEFMARFEREALAMAKCVHENIVAIYDVYVSRTPGEISYIAMELVEGTELDDFLRDHAAELKVRDVIRLFKQLARGIDAAHGAGVIHRDIKPSNIVVTQPKRIPKIMDFGIARGQLDQTLLTQTDVTIGTPAYMAPELIRGEAVGPSADIYSFAQTIYFLLARAQPYTGTSTVALMYAKVHKPPTPLREYNSLWPQELEDVLTRAMHKLPEKRPPTATKLAQELEASLRDLLDYPFRQFFTDPSSAETVVVPMPVEGRSPAMGRWMLAGGIGLLLIFSLAFVYWAVGSMFGSGGSGQHPDRMANQESLAPIAPLPAVHEPAPGDNPPLTITEPQIPTPEQNSVIAEGIKDAVDATPVSVSVAAAEPVSAPQPASEPESAPEPTSEPKSTPPAAPEPAIVISEAARILAGDYDWSGELRGAPRELDLALIDAVFKDRLRQAVYRADNSEIDKALAQVDEESRLRFIALIETLVRQNHQIRLYYSREAARVDGRFALIEFETGLTGRSRSSNIEADVTLLPRFKTKAVLQKSGREWVPATWPHFTNPQ